MSFLRRLAAASNPPSTANPNPANPVLVSVVPVFARRCPSLAFTPCALESAASASVPVLPLEPLSDALAVTKLAPGISTTCPSG